MIETIASDNPKGAAVQDIEKELVNLWRQVGTQEKPMLKARVFTLVVVAPEAEEAERAECIMQLAGRHPARNLLLLLDLESQDEYLDADVTLLCSVRPHALCAEQIRLHARGAALEHVPAAVRGLLTANLSVVLWWTLPPEPDNPLFQQLAALSDRVIVDSDALEDVSGLLTLKPEVQGHRLSDLNWSRIRHWREAIAQCFDSPMQREFLPQISQVTIETGQNSAAGWLLVGWLASRLGWQSQHVAENQARFKNPDGGTIEVDIALGKGDVTVSAVTLADGDLKFEVRRMGDACLQSTSVLPNMPPLEQITMLPDESEPAILSRELDRTMGDAVYAQALAAVQGILEKRE